MSTGSYIEAFLSYSVQFKDLVLTGEDGRSNPDLIGYFKVCSAISVSLDFIESCSADKPSITIACSLHGRSNYCMFYMDMIFTVVAVQGFK